MSRLSVHRYFLLFNISNSEIVLSKARGPKTFVKNNLASPHLLSLESVVEVSKFKIWRLEELKVLGYGM